MFVPTILISLALSSARGGTATASKVSLLATFGLIWPQLQFPDVTSMDVVLIRQEILPETLQQPATAECFPCAYSGCH